MNYTSNYYDLEPVKTRNRQLIEMFLEAYAIMKAKKHKNPKLKAIKWVVNNGSPNYHVGFDRSNIALNKLEHGKLPCREGSAAIAMWREIDTKVNAMRQGLGISRAKAIDYVLRNCRASRFFMSEDTARIIIDNWLKQHPHSCDINKISK